MKPTRAEHDKLAKWLADRAAQRPAVHQSQPKARGDNSGTQQPPASRAPGAEAAEDSGETQPKSAKKPPRQARMHRHQSKTPARFLTNTLTKMFYMANLVRSVIIPGPLQAPDHSAYLCPPFDLPLAHHRTSSEGATLGYGVAAGSGCNAASAAGCAPLHSNEADPNSDTPPASASSSLHPPTFSLQPPASDAQPLHWTGVS